MNKTQNPQAPGHMTRKDSIACGVVLASIVITMACGAIVAGTSTDSPQRYAQVSTEVVHD